VPSWRAFHAECLADVSVEASRASYGSLRLLRTTATSRADVALKVCDYGVLAGLAWGHVPEFAVRTLVSRRAVHAGRTVLIADLTVCARRSGTECGVANDTVRAASASHSASFGRLSLRAECWNSSRISTELASVALGAHSLFCRAIPPWKALLRLSCLRRAHVSSGTFDAERATEGVGASTAWVCHGLQRAFGACWAPHAHTSSQWGVLADFARHREGGRI
jgi:hypothetical protein